jgi:hypothetical protein
MRRVQNKSARGYALVTVIVVLMILLTAGALGIRSAEHDMRAGIPTGRAVSGEPGPGGRLRASRERERPEQGTPVAHAPGSPTHAHGLAAPGTTS